MLNINFELYKPTELELLMSRHYIDNGIIFPSELTIEAVSKIFNIDIRYYTGPPFAEWEETTNGYSFIFLNCNKHRFDQKNDFFHELCHPLRHVGKQDELPKMFQELQEKQAAQFQLIAAMPFYLMMQIPVPNYWENYLHNLSERFEQPIGFVEKRMQQIIAKIEQERLDRQAIMLNLYVAESSEKYQILGIN